MNLRGVFTAIVTPFNQDGSLDEFALRGLIDEQIQAGVSGIVPCGTTGESPTLSHSEHERVIDITIEEVDKQIPVIAGTGSNSTAEAIRLSKHAAEAGADAVLLVNPYYNKPTQKGLFLHFKAIADAVSIPCVLYNIQGRTGVNLETSTLLALAEECDNIVAVKEASGDLSQMKDVINRAPRGFRVLSGDDAMTADLLKFGGDGVISVASNLVPEKIVLMVEAGLKGDWDIADKLNNDLKPLFNALFVETNPIPVKTALAMTGHIEEVFRLPMCELSKEEYRSQIATALRNLSLL